MNMIPIEIGKTDEGEPKLTTPFEVFYHRKLGVLAIFGARQTTLGSSRSPAPSFKHRPSQELLWGAVTPPMG